MAEAAKEFLKGVVVKVVHGDILESLPPGYDTHLFCDTIHMFDRPAAVEILKNSFAALPPNGTILLSNAIVDDCGTGPRNAVYFYVFMFLTGAGRSYRPVDFCAMLEEAGFTNVHFRPYYSHYTLISAKKPNDACVNK